MLLVEERGFGWPRELSSRRGPHRPERSPSAAGDPRARGEEATARRVRVLIVDDDTSFLSAAERALAIGSPGFDVTTAGNGLEAIALLKDAEADETSLPDVVLLDYHLPDTTAPSLLQRLAALPSLREIPILVLTRDERESAREDALRAGATDFAFKPSRVQALRDMVVEFWETHGTSVGDPSN